MCAHGSLSIRYQVVGHGERKTRCIVARRHSILVWSNSSLQHHRPLRLSSRARRRRVSGRPHQRYDALNMMKLGGTILYRELDAHAHAHAHAHVPLPASTTCSIARAGQEPHDHALWLSTCSKNILLYGKMEARHYYASFPPIRSGARLASSRLILVSPVILPRSHHRPSTNIGMLDDRHRDLLWVSVTFAQLYSSQIHRHAAPKSANLYCAVYVVA
nr:hypothetical protein CFP56_16697 [Quercus suber]